MKVRQSFYALALGLGLVLTSLLILRPAPPARADQTVYYVRPFAAGDCLSPATPCGSVRQAIALATAPGDEVWIATGVYSENLTITHSVTLRGSWDVSFTAQSPTFTPSVLDGGEEHNVRVEDAPLAQVVLDGLTLRNGRDGIHVWTGAVTVTRCFIHDVKKQGFEIDGGTVVISACRVFTAQQGIEVDAGKVLVQMTHIAHTSEEGLLIESGGTVTFTGNTVEDCGQQGIQVDTGQVVLSGNTLRNVNADGVRVEGGVVAVVGNRLYEIASDGLDISGTQIISGNLVAGAGRRGIYAHDGALTVVGNVVHDAAGDGIRTADGTQVLIGGNVISHTGNDGVDARGESVFVVGNLLVGCADNGLRAAGGGAVDLAANRVFNAGVGLAVRGGDLFTITNNIIADSITGSVELESAGGGYLFHNTLVGDGKGVRGIGVNVLSPMTVTLVNDIIVSHTTALSAVAGTAWETRYLLLWGNGGGLPGGTLVLAPPEFVAPGEQDYHLRFTSPAVDAGEEVGVTEDVDGDPRPLGARPDIGADEVWRLVYLPLVLRDATGTVLLP